MSTPIEKWVEEAARLTKPERVVWLEGGEEERVRLMEQAVQEGVFRPLNPKTYPNCYLHRSHPSDVARTEQVTFICTSKKEDAGPTNNWMAPDEAKKKVAPLFDGAMAGRTMYVVPYIMGPVNSPISKVGVEVTDSLYVAESMRIMTRVGRVALEDLYDYDQNILVRANQEISEELAAAIQSAGIERVRQAYANSEVLQGWQVDDATRGVIEQAGYGQYFCHRTGHSIGQEVHGNGANMDGLETYEERRVLPKTCFSIEPGIYLPDFGVRSETNVFVDAQGAVHVTGGDLQQAIVPLLASA